MNKKKIKLTKNYLINDSILLKKGNFIEVNDSESIFSEGIEEVLNWPESVNISTGTVKILSISTESMTRKEAESYATRIGGRLPSVEEFLEIYDLIFKKQRPRVRKLGSVSKNETSVWLENGSYDFSSIDYFRGNRDNSLTFVSGRGAPTSDDSEAARMWRVHSKKAFVIKEV